MAKMTIYVPDDLKGRMDEAEGVNWSPLACRAFEAKLAEIITQQGAKNVKDVITRLKASKAKTTDEARLRGQKVGKEWASSTAEAIQLERLEKWTELKFGTARSWNEYLLARGLKNDPFGPDHRLAETIAGEDLDQDDGVWFWVRIDGDSSERYSPPYLVGFVEGALAVWAEVNDQL
jgi:hypothetical protein